MKEILFSAKRIDNGEWVEGYIVRIDEETCFIASKEDILAAYTDNRGTYDGWMSVIDQETICQYTGLTDKNGNKIWENDVVKHYYDECHAGCIEVGVIRWNGDEARFENFRLIEKYAYYLSGKKCVYEVIGNIFDNPDLLKVGD